MTQADLFTALSRHFGFTSFRLNQEHIVRAILQGRDVFAALPTGGGKSLCYQLPALVSDGLTVVVSPLIALMKDQVDNARKNGIPAAFLNSTLSAAEAHETWFSLGKGEVKLLYASPERLSSPEFRQALGRLGLALVAVDEAHCISEWGHEFRPDYRTLGLLRKEYPSVPIAAFTATATRQVQKDVVRLLGLKKPFVVRASFDRPEIFYRVCAKRKEVNGQILEFINGHKEQPGIIYRSTRKAVEESAAYLARHGISAVAYHAGIADEERRVRQEAFVHGDALVVVATIAFGMGIDKADVRWVIHGDLPRSLEGYYQETGRAARDGKRADTVLFHSRADIATIRWHIRNIASDAERKRAEARLQDVLRYVGSSICRRRQLLAHFDEEYTGNCAACDICAGEVVLEDQTLAAQKILSAAVRTGERFGGHHLADIVVGNATDRIMERGHNLLPTFGVGRDRDRSYWLSLIQDLAAHGYLVRGEGRTAGFHLSDRGRLLLKGKETFRGVAGETAPDLFQPSGLKTHQAGTERARTELDSKEQGKLLQRLKQLRTRLARERRVPPYIIFSDKTLEAIAERNPTDDAALLQCRGVGPGKLDAYGDQVLQEIRSFLEENRT